MSHENHVVIKTEEETTTLRRSNQAAYANPTRAVKARWKGAALPIIKVEDTSDTDTASTTTESEGSRKRKRDASEDESEQKPSKRRLSEQETVQLEEEEVLQSLLEGCDEPVEPSLEVKVEPMPEISLMLWERNASEATQRTRASAPSPPESTTQVEEEFLPVTPPWSPEANQVASGLTASTDGEVLAKPKPAGASEDGVLVGGRLLRITRERRQRLELPPLEVRVAPRVVAAARKNATGTRRKRAKGRKRAAQ